MKLTTENIVLFHGYLIMIDLSAYTFLQAQDQLTAPMILMRLLIPKDIPVNCLGVDKMITFMAPTLVNDKPPIVMQDLLKLVIRLNGIEVNL